MQVSDLIEGVLTYLHQSHDYYINVALYSDGNVML